MLQKAGCCSEVIENGQMRAGGQQRVLVGSVGRAGGLGTLPADGFSVGSNPQENPDDLSPD